MTVFIGTSGWHYADWRPRFYPAKMGTAQWLTFYSQRFATVEVNNGFYRLPEKSTFAKWRQETPDDFVVAVKASRYLTHVKRLREPAEPVSRLMDRVSALGSHLGPILLQLPPNHAALCLADGGPVDVPRWRTTNWAYVRFHKGKGRPAPCYTRSALRAWAEELSQVWAPSEDVYCYFNNDTNGCALRDAGWFAAACAVHNRPVTRVPAARETKVG